jgi:hypothetical protein
MGKTSVEDVQIVAATKDGQTIYWAVAAPPDSAIEVVWNSLPAGWSPVLTNERLSPACVAALKLWRNGVREIGPVL